MSKIDGFFALRTPRDLLEKLEHDFSRIQAAAPTSRDAQYAAFDFFVTAEHLADWLKHAQGGSLTTHRSYKQGALVSHVANGAKHFRVDPSRHKEIKDHQISDGSFQHSAFQSDAFSAGRLVLEQEDGTLTPVLDVSKDVLAHWKSVVP